MKLPACSGNPTPHDPVVGMVRAAVRAPAVNGGKPVRTSPFPFWPSHDDTERLAFAEFDEALVVTTGHSRTRIT